jgi:hypothetical protein
MMKFRLLSCAIILIFSSCKPTASRSSLSVDGGCPEQGECKVTIAEGSSLLVQRDGQGKPYPSLVAGKANEVVKIEYNNPGPPGVQDAFYKEEIIFEVPSGTGDLDIKGKAIIETNILFGVFCYCKDKAGYYRVDSARITRKGDIYKVEIPEIVALQKLREVTVSAKK